MLFRTIIVKNQRQKAKDLFSFALGEAGENMFDTELSDGSFISSGSIHRLLIDLLPFDGNVQVKTGEQEGMNGEMMDIVETIWGRVLSGNAESVRELITANGQDMTLADIQSVFNDMDITDEEPFVAMLRRGVEMKTSAE